MMTPAQIARRKFKSMLPRKIQNRTLSPMQALGEAFTLLDQFRGMVRAEKQRMDASKTIYAALAYTLPGTAKLALTLTVPEPGKIGPFCEEVLGLERKKAAFLGVVFVQIDPDAKAPRCADTLDPVGKSDYIGMHANWPPSLYGAADSFAAAECRELERIYALPDNRLN